MDLFATIVVSIVDLRLPVNNLHGHHNHQRRKTKFIANPVPITGVCLEYMENMHLSLMVVVANHSFVYCFEIFRSSTSKLNGYVISEHATFAR